MRAALRVRYELLPFWYTEFYVSSVSGLPVARPLWVEFPRDKNTYNMDDQFLVGGSLLVHPVTEQYSTSAELYLPGATTVSPGSTSSLVKRLSLSWRSKYTKKAQISSLYTVRISERRFHCWSFCPSVTRFGDLSSMLREK